MSRRESLSPTVQYMGICLRVQSNDPRDLYHEAKDFFPKDKEGGVLIGRASSSDLQLPHQDVSSLHCRIELTGGVYYLEDANSSNGTFLQGRRLSPGERAPLREGDKITVAGYHITFHKRLSSMSHKGVEDALDSTALLHQHVVGDLGEPSSQPPQLRVVQGAQRGRTFELAEYEDFLIGRTDACQLKLTDDATSRQHARIRRDVNGVMICDLNSRNGVLVNNRKIPPGSEVALGHGDRVEVGLCILVFHDPFAASLEEKLKGVVLDDDDLGGATLAPSVAMQAQTPAVQKPATRPAPHRPAPTPTPQRQMPAPHNPSPTSSAKNLDVSEPVSGKWRVQKHNQEPAAPEQPAAKPVEAPKAASPKPTEKPKPAQATEKPKAAKAAEAPKQAKPQEKPKAANTPAAKAAPVSKAATKSQAKPQKAAPPAPKQQVFYLVFALLSSLLVIVLALVLAYLL